MTGGMVAQVATERTADAGLVCSVTSAAPPVEMLERQVLMAATAKWAVLGETEA
jgi:hypothetical protein